MREISQKRRGGGNKFFRNLIGTRSHFHSFFFLLSFFFPPNSRGNTFSKSFHPEGDVAPGFLSAQNFNWKIKNREQRRIDQLFFPWKHENKSCEKNNEAEKTLKRRDWTTLRASYVLTLDLWRTIGSISEGGIVKGRNNGRRKEARSKWYARTGGRLGQNDRPRSIGANNGGRTIYRSHLGYSTPAPRVKTCRGSIYRALYAVGWLYNQASCYAQSVVTVVKGLCKRELVNFQQWRSFRAQGFSFKKSLSPRKRQGEDWSIFFFRHEWYEQQVKFNFLR